MAAAASSSTPNPVSTTVEMNDLDSSSRAQGGPESTSQNITTSAVAESSSQQPTVASSSNKATLPQESNGQQSAQEDINTPAAMTAPSTTTARTPAESEPQQNTDSITPGSAPTINTSDASGPICIITLLLTSGARHPYKLDEKYLIKRNVNVPGMTESGKKDPFSISVYTLKELILREWREEWEAQPSSPSSIRLIHFGRLLDDKMPLKGIYLYIYTLSSTKSNPFLDMLHIYLILILVLQL